MSHSEQEYSRPRSETKEKGNVLGDDDVAEYSNPPSPQPWTASSDTCPKDLPAASNEPTIALLIVDLGALFKPACSVLRVARLPRRDRYRQTRQEIGGNAYDVAFAIWKSVGGLMEIADSYSSTAKVAGEDAIQPSR
ncbi:hypothetical protein DL769_001915 [Monosporascus sp. CRB-8-3]|nr:hypothetical protein DL769_001915 [Monosporascus sp. CRB-8-3]